MKSKKLVLAVLLSSMMLTFSACGGSSEKENAKEDSAIETTEQKTAESSLQADYDKLKADCDSLASENNSLKQEINELKNNTTEAPTETPTEKEVEKDKVLYEDKTLRITYKGIESPLGGDTADVKLTIENLSDIGITVQVRDTSINGIMMDPIFSTYIAVGKKANNEMSFYSLKDEGIDKIETMEFSFHVFGSEDWDTIVDTDPIILDFS